MNDKTEDSGSFYSTVWSLHLTHFSYLFHWRQWLYHIWNQLSFNFIFVQQLLQINAQKSDHQYKCTQLVFTIWHTNELTSLWCIFRLCRVSLVCTWFRMGQVDHTGARSRLLALLIWYVVAICYLSVNSVLPILPHSVYHALAICLGTFVSLSTNLPILSHFHHILLFSVVKCCYNTQARSPISVEGERAGAGGSDRRRWGIISWKQYEDCCEVQCIYCMPLVIALLVF